MHNESLDHDIVDWYKLVEEARAKAEASRRDRNCLLQVRVMHIMNKLIEHQ